jgi:hypothetical protein
MAMKVLVVEDNATGADNQLLAYRPAPGRLIYSRPGVGFVAHLSLVGADDTLALAPRPSSDAKPMSADKTERAGKEPLPAR